MMLNRCPAESDLLQLVHSAKRSQRDLAMVERHVAQCDRCQETVRHLRESIASLASSRGAELEGGPDCLEADTVAALADGSLPSDRRSAAVAHLAVCGHCRVELAAVCSALPDPAVGGAPRSRRRDVVAGLGLVACAAAAILVVAVHRPHDAPAPQLRDDVLPAHVPATLAPRGSISAAPVFRWSSAPSADRYHVTVFTADGAVVWETETADTTVAAPITPWHHDVNYFWKVAARTAFDRWSGSRLVMFRWTGSESR